MVRNTPDRLVEQLHDRFAQGSGESVALAPQERVRLQERLARLHRLGPEFQAIRLSGELTPAYPTGSTRA